MEHKPLGSQKKDAKDEKKVRKRPTTADFTPDQLGSARGKPLNYGTFSVKGGIHGLITEISSQIGVRGVKISSRAIIIVNDLARDVLLKFATAIRGIDGPGFTTFQENDATIHAGNVITVSRAARHRNGELQYDKRQEVIRILGTLDAAARLVIKDKDLLTLNNTNAQNCCQYEHYLKDPERHVVKEGEEDQDGGNEAESNMNKMPISYIGRWFKNVLMSGYKMGKDSRRQLTTRVEHLVGELLGTVISALKDSKKKKIKVRHIAHALRHDPELEACFWTLESKTPPHQAIGAGMPSETYENGKLADPKYQLKPRKKNTVSSEPTSIEPGMWACVQPYDRTTRASKADKFVACLRGAPPRKGYPELYPDRKRCTQACVL